MAGYSGTPLPKKLGIKENDSVALMNAPSGFRDRLSKLPDGVVLRRDARTSKAFDIVVLFVEKRAELRKRFSALAQKLTPAGGLWVAWPKKTSKKPTDLSEGTVREVGLAAGLVDNKVCAIDETWSGLRFVIRVSDRPERAT